MAERRLVVNIRGCNGSGKTSLIRRMLDYYGNTPLKNEKGDIWAYKVHFEPPFFVVGCYDDLEGGCDNISSIKRIQERVRKLAKLGNVVFEGITVSFLTKPWIELAESLPDVHFIFGTLDTPLDKCIRRREARRKKMGKGPAGGKGVTLKHRAVKKAHKALKREGLDVRWLSHKYSKQELTNWLLEGNDD